MATNIVNVKDDGPKSREEPANSSTLFVGDLSFFCSEIDLSVLFSSYGKVIQAQLKKGRSGDSLMHGFVEMENFEQAEAARVALMDRKYMGRKIRVNWAFTAVIPRNREGWVQVHVSFVTRDFNHIINEEVLDSIFSVYGEVADITIKRYVRDIDSQVQSGYGFIFFLSPDAAAAAVKKVRKILIQGVTYDSSLSYRSEKELSAKSENSPKSSESRNIESFSNSPYSNHDGQGYLQQQQIPNGNYAMGPMGPTYGGPHGHSVAPLLVQPYDSPPMPQSFGQGNQQQSPVFYAVPSPQHYPNVSHPNSPARGFHVSQSPTNQYSPTVSPRSTNFPFPPNQMGSMDANGGPGQYGTVVHPSYSNYAPYPMMPQHSPMPIPLPYPQPYYVPQQYPEANRNMPSPFAMNMPPPAPTVTIPTHSPSPNSAFHAGLQVQIPGSYGEPVPVNRNHHNTSPVPSPSSYQQMYRPSSGSGSNQSTPKNSKGRNMFSSSPLHTFSSSSIDTSGKTNPSPRDASSFIRPPVSKRSMSNDKISPKNSMMGFSTDSVNQSPGSTVLPCNSSSLDEAVDKLAVGIGAIGNGDFDPSTSSSSPVYRRPSC